MTLVGALWVYKCDARERPDVDSGDWRDFFRAARKTSPVWWGSTEWIRSHSSRMNIRDRMRPGDLVLAWQVDRAEAVGLARVASVRERDGWFDMFLEAQEQFEEPVRLRELRRTDPTLSRVRAFRQGSQGTIHATSKTEATALLHACGAVGYRVKGEARPKARRRGAGFGDVDRNRETEKAAVRAVRTWLRDNGWDQRSVERENLGYDVEALRGDEVAHVEVKGVSGSEPRFLITENEKRQADADPAYWLCVVTEALSPRRRRLHWWTGDQLKRFEIRPVAYFASPATARRKAGPR